MSGKVERGRARQVQDRCQRLLAELLRDDDNKYCVDCDAKGPRWASWNLGIFLCIRCAGIHRNLGVHISKVKSVNLDSWTPEQVVSLQQMGNSRARAVYEANLPDAFRRPQTDSSLEAFIRAKYEHRKYVAREWVPPSPPQVNWDKEIDEEIEKQKKKKKSSSSSTTTSGNSISSTEKKSNSSNIVPKLLPKPKSSVSPKPGRATPKRETSATADLLGTGNATVAPTEPSTQNNFSDDVFSSFLSAPHEPAVAPDTNKNAVETNKVVDLKSEEESFFNQPAPSEKEKSKMTKDSILALYGQAPLKNVPAGQFAPFNSAIGFPQQPNSAFGQGFPAFPPQMQVPPVLQTQNFATGFNQLNSLPAQNTFNSQFQTNQFASLQNFTVNPNQNTAQYQGTNLNGMFPQPNQSVNGSSLFSQSNLSQQFGGMSLGQTGQPTNAFPAQQGTMTGAFPNAAQPNVAANGDWP